MIKTKKIIFILVMSLVLIASCENDKLQLKNHTFKSLIEDDHTLAIKDTTHLLTMLNDFEVYKDSLIFFTDFFTRAMYKYDISLDKVDVLGNNGKGPGEYVRPGKLFIAEDRIYYSDFGEFGISYFGFNGENPAEIKNKLLLNSGIKDFILDEKGDLICLRNPHSIGTFVFTSTGKKYGKALPIFVSKRLGRPFAGMHKSKNMLYFMFLPESKIYKVNLETGEENHIQIELPGFFDWDNVKNEKLTRELIKETRESYARAFRFFGFEHHGKTYFYINTFSKRDGSLHFICNDKGDIKFSIEGLDDYTIHTCSNKYFYAYTINENKFNIISYEWNSKFKSLLSE